MSKLLKLLSLLLVPFWILCEDQKPDQLNFNFQQNDYKLTFEHADVASYNKDLVHYFKFVTFKHNRTCTALNASANFKVTLGNNVTVVLQAYKFASNEYRLFPLRFQFNFCDVLSKNMFGISAISKCGNFTGCPVLKDTHYQVCNFVPDPTQFPPMIPTGRYMAELQPLYLNKELGIGRAYVEVARPFTGK